MAEYCFECFKKVLEKNAKEREYILSGDLDLCEVCGEWKRVVVRVKNPKMYMWKKKMRARFSFTLANGKFM